MEQFSFFYDFFVIYLLKTLGFDQVWWQSVAARERWVGFYKKEGEGKVSLLKNLFFYHLLIGCHRLPIDKPLAIHSMITMHLPP